MTSAEARPYWASRHQWVLPLLFLPAVFTIVGVEAPVGASWLFLPVVFTILGVQGVSGAAVPHHAVPSGSPLSGALETPEPHDDDVCPRIPKNFYPLTCASHE